VPVHKSFSTVKGGMTRGLVKELNKSLPKDRMQAQEDKDFWNRLNKLFTPGQN